MAKSGRTWSLAALEPSNITFIEEFEALIGILRLDDIAPGRFSSLLALSLYGGFKAGTLDPYRAVLEIEALENGNPSHYKDSIQNKRPPLKGLWHKHFGQLGLRPLALNVQNALKKYELPYVAEKIRQAQESGEERFFTVEDAAAIANDAVQGNYARRQKSGGLTGEWIVFAKHEGKNYYLALATHDSSTHIHIRQQIDLLCMREFPFLEDLLALSETEARVTERDDL